MRVERFKAPDMREAMRQVKEKLGQDAVILHTRTVPNSSLFGLSRKNEIEIIAAIDQTPSNGRLWKPESLLQKNNESGADQTSMETTSPSFNGRNISSRGVPSEHLQAPKTTPSPMSKTNSAPFEQLDWDTFIKSATQNGKEAVKYERREPNGIKQERDQPEFVKLLDKEVASVELERRLWLESEKRLSNMKKEMNELKEILLKQEMGDLKRRAEEVQAQEKNQQIKQREIEKQEGQSLLYQRMSERLAERGIAVQIAKEIVEKVKKRIEVGKISLTSKTSINKVRDLLADEIANLVPIVPKNLAPYSKPRILAFVGPPGCGKSSVCSKLAVKNAYLYGKKVALIMANMSGIGVAQHLSSIASITQLPLSVVQTPKELKAAITAYQDKDYVFIDFSGKNEENHNKPSLLSRLIKSASPHETHLVLPANLKTSDALAVAKSFHSTHFDRIVISRFDETTSVGSLLEVLQKVSKPVSYFSTGAIIPDDIEPASATKLAHKVLCG